MVFWKSHICFVLLLAFSSLNLIYSDCTDVDRFNGGFCNNRNLRRADDSSYDKDFSQRRIRHFSERRDERAELREREKRREYDELRRDSNYARQAYRDEEQRRVDGEERRFERRDDLNRHHRDERAERVHVYNVVRRDVAQNERNSRMIHREIDDAQLRLADRQRLDERRNERTEIDRLNGDRRIETQREREVGTLERMETQHRRISTENSRRVDERRMEREREIYEQRKVDRMERRDIRIRQNHPERTERDSIRREDDVGADRRETERLDERTRFDGDRRNEIRRSTTEERRIRSIESLRRDGRRNERADRTEMDRRSNRLSGDRRKMETQREEEVARNIRLEEERRDVATDQMEIQQRRIPTENRRRVDEQRMQRERQVDRLERRDSRARQDHLERTERNSIRRENDETSDRRESIRAIESMRRNDRRMERESQEYRRLERSEGRETERNIRIEARRNDERREARNIWAHISEQQNFLAADAEMEIKKSQLIPSGLAWPLLQLTILGVIIAHIIKKDDYIKPKNFGNYFNAFFASTAAKTVKAL